MVTLSDIKAGDEVALYYGSRSDPRVAKVIKITATQIVIASFGNGSEWRFRRDTGREVGGDGYLRSSVSPLTDEVRQQIKRNAALVSLREMRWTRFDDKTLFAVMDMLRDAINPKRPTTCA